MKIRYIGELLDHTGYGEAARINISLLDKMGHEVQCVPVGAQTSTDQDWKMQTVLKCMQFDKESKPDIVFTHIYPPANIQKFLIPGVPTISYLAWETDMLPSVWTHHINRYADVVCTTANETKEVFRKSGIKPNVHVIGPTMFNDDIHTINTASPTNGELTPGLQKIYDAGKFIFYSVFQWIERKDPRKLVSAFIQEFDSTEDVMLLIKSYRLDYSQEQTKLMINSINTINREMNIIYPPETRIIPNRLSTVEIQQLHRMCDCYVTPHRGEGTGLGIIDAICHERGVITTPYGGPSDFTNDKDSRWLKHDMVPIQNPLYCYNYFNAYMMWADVDIMDLRKALRDTFNSRGKNLNTKSAKEYLLKQYSQEANQERMEKLLNEVCH